QNVSESLQRVPGLTIIRDEGEGRFVTIRGLAPSFTQVTVSNAQLGSSDDGSRSVALDVIPSDLLSQITVVKTLLPDVDHDSLGAKIDLRPLSAFDRSQSFSGRVLGQGTLTALARDVRPKVAADLTHRRYVGPGELGVAAAFNYFQREIQLDRLIADSDGGIRQVNNFLSLTELDQRVELGRRNRIGGTFSLDYEIADRHDWNFSVLVGRLNDDDIRVQQEVEIGDSSGGETLQIGPRFGIFSDVDIDRQIFFQPRVETTYALHFEGKNTVADGWRLGYAVDYSRNRFTLTPGLRGRFRERDLVIAADTLTENGGFTVLGRGDLDGGGGFRAGLRNIDFNFRPRLSDFEFGELLIINEDRTDEIFSYNVDLERETSLFGRPARFKVGWKQRFRDRSFIRGENSLDGDDLTAQAGLFPATLADVPGFTPRSDLNLGGGLAEGFVIPELQFTRNFLQDLATASGIQPDGTPENFEVTEDTRAGYVLGDFDVTSTFQIIAGFRVESSDYTAVGSVDREITLDGVLLEALSTSQVESFQNNYTNFFPALHLRWNTTPDLVTRFSYSRAQVRPAFDDASPLLALSFDLDTPTGVPGEQVLNANLGGQVTPVVVGGEGASLDGGNPFLKPLTADQLDFNLGWYPSDNLNITFSAFYKRLQDTFVDVSADSPEAFALLGVDIVDPFTGLPVTFADTTINGERGRLYGLEFSYNYFFKDLLPAPFNGLFTTGNVTLIDSQTSSPLIRNNEPFRLPDQSNFVANASLGYENEKFLFRIAANYRGGQLRSVDAEDRFADEFVQDFFSYDASVRYNITPNLQIFVDGVNLANERESRIFRGDGNGPLVERADRFGRTLQFGVIVNF
ncbi:MAG: TonB-dependent receptor, partial [Hyphomonadaceae bacterium]|nr:TonB-dependent receptor [Hyphomonadaceae bacterium]